MREWPKFFIVGAPKAGTTSLFRYLGQQPGIFLPENKEPHFFCPDMAERLQIERPVSERDYLKLFEPAGEDELCGEASSGYLRAPEAPEHIRQKVPDAKIIIMLREPGERAFSHYLMRWRAGGFRMSFSEGLANYKQDSLEYGLFRQLVLDPGFYGAQIPRYIANFGSDQVKIIIADDFFTDPRTVVRETLMFLGVRDIVEFTEFKKHNDYVAPRGRLALMLLRQKHRLRFLKPLIPAQLKWHLIRKYFNKRAEKPSISPMERQILDEIYDADLREVRRLVDRPDLWSRTVSAGQGNSEDTSLLNSKLEPRRA